MDGFDDLLRSSIEDNPFGDPFAKRAASPDPWNTNWATTNDELDPTSPHDLTSDPFASARSPTPTQEAPEAPLSSEPLDVASLPPDEPTEPGPKLPGFRESIATPPEQHTPADPLDLGSLTLHDAAAEPKAAAFEAAKPLSVPVRAPTPPPIPSPPTPAEPLPPQLSPPHTPTRPSQPSSAFASPTSSNFRAPAVLSPLERPAHADAPFPNLALGGETQSWQPAPWGGAAGWGSESAGSGSVAVSRNASVDDDDDDDDDDIPIAQAQAKRLSANGNGAVAAKPSETQFTITVNDPQKVGDPIRGYTMYTVHTTTTSPLFSKTEFSVLRRYSDFLWLYETLSANNPGVVVPPVPEKAPFGRFDSQFVQNRRFALERCINKTANHPMLVKDADLKMFLESDSFALDIKHRKAEIAHERGGLMASLGQTIAGPRFYEMDEWFDRQKTYLDALETQLRGLVKAIELVARQRQELSAAIGEFAQTIADLSQSDLGKTLAASLGAVADIERRAQDLEAAQAEADMLTFMSTADEYARLINSVRLAFGGRIRTYGTWQSADAEVRRVKQAHEKNRAQGRILPERMGFALNQIADAERRAMEAKQEFDACSRRIKHEVGRFELERVEDFKAALELFLDGMIDRQKQLIGVWEGYQQSLLKRAGIAAQA